MSDFITSFSPHRHPYKFLIAIRSKSLTDMKGLPNIMQPLKGAAEIQTKVVDSKRLLLTLSGSSILKLSCRILGMGKRRGARLPLLLEEKIMN